MADFEIDTVGNDALLTKYNNVKDSDSENEEEIVVKTLSKHSKRDTVRRFFEDEYSLDDTYLSNCDPLPTASKSSKHSDIDVIMAKSVFQPGAEKTSLPPALSSRRALKAARKKLKDSSKGTKWYNLPATEVTDELKNDLELLKMRSALDPKHFYKKNDIKTLPKYFQVGKVVEGPTDFYSSRIPKSQRKRTIVDELLAEADLKKYNKKKFKEIVDQNRRKGFRREMRDKTKKSKKQLREKKFEN